jgi:hypothetical protein
MKHGVRCWFRWPRWKSIYDTDGHVWRQVCTKCGHSKVTTSDTIDNIWGTPGGSG